MLNDSKNLTVLLDVWIKFAVPATINGEFMLVGTEFLKENNVFNILFQASLINHKGIPIATGNSEILSSNSSLQLSAIKESRQETFANI